MAADGLTNREIAQALFVTTRPSRSTSRTPTRSSTSPRATSCRACSRARRGSASRSIRGVSNLARRPSRKELEKRAYRFGLATAATGLATLVVLVLAVAGVAGFGTAFVLALLTAAFGYGFKRSVTRR